MRYADPSDPIPLLAAINEFARRWEANAGNLSGTGNPAAGWPPRPIWEMSEEELMRHFGTFADAAAGVFFVAVIRRKIRVWVESGPDWKRPTLITIRSLLPPGSGLYADQEELLDVLGPRWPAAYPAVLHTTPKPNAGPNGTLTPGAVIGANTPASIKRNPGPEKGPGYSPKDVPTFKLILQAQRQSGDVETKHALVKRFAGDPDGIYYKSNVERLRKGLPKWLVKIGQRWSPN